MAQFILVTKDVHYKIMSYLGYQLVRKIYPKNTLMVNDFIKKDFILHSLQECKNFAKDLSLKNESIIMILCKFHPILYYLDHLEADEEMPFFNMVKQVLNSEIVI